MCRADKLVTVEGVAGHGYGGFGGGIDAGGWLYVYGAKPGGLVAYRKMPEHFPNAG